MAIEHIQQKIIQKNMQIKIIFMDCNMPDLDGFQTSKLIMDLCKKHEVQMPYIFALTAYSKDNKELNEKCLLNGMQSCLQKPISTD
jgi:CheY-like chemotaxis protein